MSRIRLMTGVVGAVAMFLATIAGGVAQEATPEEVIAHPSHIHKGSCAELDPAPAYPLADVIPVEVDGVDIGATTVEVSLDDLLASPHAINVHDSAENASLSIACGDISGPVVDGKLVMGMFELNESNHVGVAVLESNDAGGTDVTMYLVYIGAS